MNKVWFCHWSPALGLRPLWKLDLEEAESRMDLLNYSVTSLKEAHFLIRPLEDPIVEEYLARIGLLDNQKEINFVPTTINESAHAS